MKLMKSLILVMLLVVIVKVGEGGKILSKVDWNGKDPIMQINTYQHTIEMRVFLPTEMNRGYVTTKEGCNMYFTNSCVLKQPYVGEEQVTTYLTEKEVMSIK
jgi:hypothetical protein